MKEVKPTKSRKPKLELPTQESANDTSNWENRNISAVTLDKTKAKRIVRQVEFLKPKELQVITLSQMRKEMETQGLSKEQIDKRLNGLDSSTKFLR